MSHLISTEVSDDVWKRLNYLLEYLTIDEMLLLIDDYMPWNRIGVGNRRSVYELPYRRVMKVPLSHDGISDSLNEIRLWEESVKCGLDKHLPIIEGGNKYYLIQEKLRVFETEKEFQPYLESAFGILEGLSCIGVTDHDHNTVRMDTLESTLRSEQWGLRDDGTLVLLDFGFDRYA